MLFAYNSCEIFFQVEASVEFVIGLVGAKTHTYMHLGFEPIDSLIGNSTRHTCLAGADIGIEAGLLAQRRLQLRIHFIY
jgi:hypothetical protein